MDKSPRIYCDMDGVLCDFVKGIEKLHKIKISNWSYGSKQEKWSLVKSTPKFWHTLPWHTGARQLWSYIKKHDTHILSAYVCLLYTSPSPRDVEESRMPSSA